MTSTPKPRKRDGGNPLLGGRGAALEGRNGAIWRGYTVYRRTQEDLAEEFGISQQTVSEIIRNVRASIPEDDLDQMRRESLELYAELGRRAMEIVDLVPAPLLAGKDGLPQHDPDTGEVIRDYSGRLRAMETAAKFDEHRRKLMGLDAAQKAEVAGQVRFEIVGVDTSDLS